MSLDNDPIWSSKISIVACTAVTNVWVLFGCFARELIFGTDIVGLQLYSGGCSIDWISLQCIKEYAALI